VLDKISGMLLASYGGTVLGSQELYLDNKGNLQDSGNKEDVFTGKTKTLADFKSRLVSLDDAELENAKTVIKTLASLPLINAGLCL
jgi:hypothetical protein